MLQALITSLNGPQPYRGPQGGSHGAGPRDDPIEIGLMKALSCLQARPNFHEIVSTTNDYHQTFAHLAILYDYPSLLGRLVEWRIDLTIADVNGLTALHCAYMKGDPDSVRILRRGGASKSATDKLGRTPSGLQPEGLGGFDLDIDLDVELAAGLDADVYPEANDINEQLALGERFSTLDSGNDSGLSTGSGEGGGGTSGSGSGPIASRSKKPAIRIMDQSPLERNKRRKKNRSHRMLTFYDAAVSGISNRLREAKIFPTPPNRPSFPIVYRDSSIVHMIHPNVNGTLTTEFSPAAFSITALDLNVSTPKFEGGKFPYHDGVTSQLPLIRPVFVQISGVVLSLVLPNWSQLVLWCYTGVCILSSHSQYSPIGSHLDPARDEKCGLKLDLSSGTHTSDVTFYFQHRTRQTKAYNQTRHCYFEELV